MHWVRYIMNVAFVNDYASLPGEGGPIRHFQLASAILEDGANRTVIIRAESSHLRDLTLDAAGEVEIVNIKTVRYDRASSWLRAVKWLQFTLKVTFCATLWRSRWDIYLCGSSNPLVFLPLWLMARLKSVKVVFEVRDIWPLTLCELGGHSHWNPMILAMRFAEKFALQNADLVLSPLTNYQQYLSDHGSTVPFEWVPNGIDHTMLAASTAVSSKKIRDDADDVVFVYAGKLGVSNDVSGLATLCQSVLALEGTHLIICGEGECEAQLAGELALEERATFTGWLTDAALTELLAECHVGVISWRETGLYRYGTGANKIGRYLGAGLLVLQQIDGGGDLLEKSGLGYSVAREDTLARENAVRELAASIRSGRQQARSRALRFAADNYDAASIGNKFRTALENLCEQ